MQANTLGKNTGYQQQQILLADLLPHYGLNQL